MSNFRDPFMDDELSVTDPTDREACWRDRRLLSDSELLRDILSKAMIQRGTTLTVRIEGGDLRELLDTVCYRALQKIQRALDDYALKGDDTGDDFMCIETILAVFEEMGSGVLACHDFG